ncbi:MAG: DUF1189 family protein [Clostridia bacterium]|jgi:hypothetical protein|nr:DUF1189 family protein [Clostridia bacterium]
MEKAKKINFFKRLKMAIFQLENYIEFINERLYKAIGFCIKMTIVCSIIIVISNAIFIYKKYGSPTKYVDNMVPNFSYEENDLKIDEKDAKSSENKEMVATVMKKIKPSLVTVLGDSSYNKALLIKDIEANERQVIIIAGVAIFLESLIEIFSFWIILAIMTSVIGWLVLSFSRLKMRYSKLFALSIYASTLTTVISVIYILLNSFFGIYIEVFDYLSMLIAYIYITAVIYMIKSDLIKQQMELIRIATVQAKVKEQLKEEDNKDTEEKEKKDNKDGDKKEEKKKDNEVLNDEPDGSEI